MSQADRSAATIGRRARRTGLALSGVAVLFLLADTAVKVLQLPPAIEGTTQLGDAANAVLPIGVIELACLALYIVPRTSVVGGLLLTGYLGGAVATHVRADSPLFSHTLFPLYVAAFVWGGLYLRDRRARVLAASR